MRRGFFIIPVFSLIFSTISLAQGEPSINSTNNNGIITQGQKGNNYLYQLPPIRPNGIYQNKNLIGKIENIIFLGKNKVKLSFPRIDSDYYDFSQPIEVQGHKLMCDYLTSQYEPNAIEGTIHTGYMGDMPCIELEK